MTALAIFLPCGLVLVAICFTGGWHLRGLRDRYRTEVARDRARDEAMKQAGWREGGSGGTYWREGG